MSDQTEDTPQPKPLRGIKPQAIVRALIYLILPPALLFGIAGTFNWPMGWVYIIVTFGGVILSRVLVAKAHPDLLSERASSLEAKDVPAWDRKLVPFVSTIIPLLMMLVAGLDHRYNWSPPTSVWVHLLGLVLVVAAVVLAILAMLANRFFSAYARIQNERGQQVVSRGPYAVLRHPGYAAGILTNLGAPLMLGAMWVFVPSILGIGLICLRTSLEDKFLQENLPGYAAYTSQVRWRLLPYIW